MMNTRQDIWHIWWARLASLAILFTILAAGLSRADTWNDKTRLRFSEAIMVPGTTLPPGEYVFALMDLRANRHLVQIKNAKENTVLATAQAVPVKRQDPQGTTTLTFNPTSAGTAPALKAWYYPGSIYGHEFIYPENEARMLANRDKTIVLSEDRAAGDHDAAGSLQVYDADGSASPWRADEAVIREWSSWSQGRTARARTATDAARPAEDRQATAPLVDSAGRAMRVPLDDVEQQPNTYIGKRISVDAEVEKVIGPRLFTIDEPDWADLDGELLVHVPTALAALVRPDDRVTITGTVTAYASGELDDEWRWFDASNDTSHWRTRPVLVATHVVGGDDSRALLITRGASEDTRRSSAPLGTVNAVTADAVGRTVELDGVEVQRIVPGRGFFISSGTKSIFVRPAGGEHARIEPGQKLSVDGFVLTLPAGISDEVFDDAADGGRIYVFATDIS
jgi:hypothetical protein